MSKTGIFIGLGILAAGGGVAWYLYNKNKSTTSLIDTTTTSTSTSSVATASNSPVVTPPAQPGQAGVVNQTIWKDADGHVFELTNQEDKYGFLLKVDGGGSSKAVTVTLDNTGHIVTKNKAGETWTYKNGWSRLSGLRGLGNAYSLNGDSYALNAAPIPMLKPMRLQGAYALN